MSTAATTTDSPKLEPVRESYRSGQSLRWTRVHDLPDFVYFNHSIHVKKGVGCVECHGRVDLMPLTYSVQSLQMEWCLDCHRDPGPHLNDRALAFDLAAPRPDPETARSLVQQYHVQPNVNCSTCHR